MYVVKFPSVVQLQVNNCDNRGITALSPSLLEFSFC